MSDDQSSELLNRLRAGFAWQSQLAELEQSFDQGTARIDEIRQKLADLWPNVSLTQSWAVKQAKDDPRAAILCSKLAGCAGRLLEQELGSLLLVVEGGRPMLIRWREEAVEAIARYLPEGRLPAEVHDDLVHDLLGHLTYLGYLHMADGNMGRARATLERALHEGVAYGNRFAEGVVHLHLAMIALREEDLDRAEGDLRLAIAAAEPADDRNILASSHNLLGVIASNRGKAGEAVAEYGTAARLFEELNRQSGAGTAYANRSGVLLDLGRLDEATQDLERAEAIASTLQSQQLTGLCKVNRARLLWVSKGADRAEIVKMLEGALTDFRESGDIPQMRRVEKILGEIASSAPPEIDETPRPRD
jgi:tetratricopeptide (TPR) repeat protein